MTPEEKDQLLDRYVAGHPMSADEEAQVHRLLNADTDFRSEYQLRQTLLEAGEQARRVAWEAQQQVRPLPVKQTAFPMSWVAAASIVLVLGVSLFWWLRSANEQPLMGQVMLYEQPDTQLGLAGSDSSAVGTATWVVTQSTESQYDFGQVDTLRIFSPDPKQWAGQTWRLTRLSEVRYQLRVGNQTYLLEQGLNARLPLAPEK